MQYKPPSDEAERVFRIGRKQSPHPDDSFSEVINSRPAVEPTDSRPPSKPHTQIVRDVEPIRGRELRPRGHLITYISLFIFTAILYFRPYELIPALSSLNTIAFYSGVLTLGIFLITQISTEGNLSARPREIVLALLLVILALLSMPLAINPGEAWKTFTDIFIKAVLIFVVIVNVVKTERRLRYLLLLSLGVSVYLSIGALHDYRLGIFKFGTAEDNNLRIAGSIGGLFGNSNDLALHLCTMVPITIAMAFIERGLVKKFIFVASGILMIAAIVVTFSRGGFIALVISGVVLARKLGRRNTMLTAAALIIAAILFVALLPGGYSGRLSTIFHSTADVTGSSSQRTEVLKRSIAVALRYPIFGVGIGNFHYKSVHELQTHNAYTQVAAEMGIAAFVIYLLFLVHPLRRLRQIERTTFERGQRSRFYYLSIGLQASLVAYMVASFFGAVAYQWYVYYLVGYAVACRNIYQTQIDRNPEAASFATSAGGETPRANLKNVISSFHSETQTDWAKNG